MYFSCMHGSAQRGTQEREFDAKNVDFSPARWIGHCGLQISGKLDTQYKDP
jgi:hypothetical protein